MGLLWTIAYPFTTVLVLWFIFTQAFRVQPPKGDTPYIVWLLVGMAAWNFFADALVSVTGCINGNGYMLKKRSFNMYALPVIHALAALFSHCVFLMITMAFCFFYGILPSLSWFQLLYYAAYLFLLCLGLGYFAATIAVFIPDVLNAVNIFIQVFFWATPVFWSFSMLPPGYASILQANPVAFAVQGYRNAMLGEGSFGVEPAKAAIFWLVAGSILFLALKFFKKMKPHFADVL
ncbi:MAG: Teichoic acid translocation permease protein TagG [Desulfovibrio sp.]